MVVKCGPLYALQKHRLSIFQLYCLRTLLCMTWQDHVSSIDVLDKAGMAIIHSMLTTRRQRWLGHVSRLKDSRIPKNLLFGELACGTRATGPPSLGLKGVCKCELKAGGLNISELRTATPDQHKWRAMTRQVTNAAEERRNARYEEREPGKTFRFSPT